MNTYNLSDDYISIKLKNIVFIIDSTTKNIINTNDYTKKSWGITLERQVFRETGNKPHGKTMSAPAEFRNGNNNYIPFLGRLKNNINPPGTIQIRNDLDKIRGEFNVG